MVGGRKVKVKVMGKGEKITAGNGGRRYFMGAQGKLRSSYPANANPKPAKSCTRVIKLLPHESDQVTGQRSQVNCAEISRILFTHLYSPEGNGLQERV